MINAATVLFLVLIALAVAVGMSAPHDAACEKSPAAAQEPPPNPEVHPLRRVAPSSDPASALSAAR